MINLNKTDYLLSKINENIELVIYSITVFIVPFLLGHYPQWFVGTIVNTSLILGGLNLKNIKLLPIIVLPSIAVLSRGLIFDNLTIFLLYMIPFIWIGNSVLVLSMKLNLNKMYKLIIGIITKVSIILLGCLILVKLNIIPQQFITLMGSVQLYTAIGGGLIALTIQSIKKRI